MEQKRREFTEFYAAAKDDCLRIVLVSVGDRQLAEDLVAEASGKARGSSAATLRPGWGRASAR